MSGDSKKEEETEEYGVLLYYKYTSIPDLNSLVDFYESNCSSVGLLGRVRLAPHGVNVTVGGKLSSLENHIAAVKSNSLFEGTDFKLATCHQPLNDKVAIECGFTSLCVRIVKELVTFSSHPLLNPPTISNAGRHLSAAEFHSVLRSAGQLLDGESSSDDKGLVLLDARNLYETRIGKFHTPSVETLDPGIRQYSDLPSWIDDNADQLRGKNILMYCTGGIRCEMASAYVKSKGAGFENVFQLYGGIQRYLEQFPDGGFFKGKNFVFDHRISVGSSDADILGNCLLCGSTFDDYSSRCRCTHCRMLVLVCDNCRKEGALYVCELCQKHGKGISLFPFTEDGRSEATLQQIELNGETSVSTPSSQLSWRNGKLNNIFHTKQKVITSKSSVEQTYSIMCPRKLRILCLHGFRQNALGFKGRTASLVKKLKAIAEFIYIDAPHELPFIYQPCGDSSQQQNGPPPLSDNCKKKFAWLVAPGSAETNEIDWKVADGPFSTLQYQQQTDGFDISLAYLKKIFSQEGPFDGILGFSQGAAMAALICAQWERLKGEIDFRFVVLCSGFALPIAECKQGSINCPSLHIFGSNMGKDRQIANQASKDLASLFDDGCSIVMEHNCGHIIPTRSPYIDEIKSYLHCFV